MTSNTSTTRPTMEELREFARLPWIRCSCGKVTGRLQDKFDQILADKEKTYYENLEPLYNTLLEQGFDDITAQRMADRQARVISDVIFNRRVTNELGIRNECCFNTLMNPIILPLGSGIGLDPEVDVGDRLSRLQIKEEPKPVLPTGNVVPQPVGKRVYRAI